MPSMTTIRETHDLAARTGRGFEVEAGELIRITDLEGSQPVDFWGLQQGRSPGVPLLRAHQAVHREAVPPCRRFRLHQPAAQDRHGRRRHTSPGQHDMQYAACDPTRYAELGVEGYHESCQENLHTALEGFGIALQFTPQPWNLFTNFFINPDGSFTIKAAGIQVGRMHRAPGRDGRHHRGLRLPPGSEPHLRRPAHRHPGRGRTLTWCGRRPFRRSPAPPSAAGNGRTKSAAVNGAV